MVGSWAGAGRKGSYQRGSRRWSILAVRDVPDKLGCRSGVGPRAGGWRGRRIARPERGQSPSKGQRRVW